MNKLKQLYFITALLFAKHTICIVIITVFAVLVLGCTSLNDIPLIGGLFTSSNSNDGDQQQSNSSLTEQQRGALYWTGNGGSGIRLGILLPQSQNLNEAQEYLPSMVQGVLVSNISTYSAISVLDRVSLDRVITETLDLTYEDDLDIVSLGRVAQVGHMMTGNIIRTSTGFSLHFNITDTTPNANTLASYSGTCSAAELDDHSAINRASLELLRQMDVQLTARARNELGRASNQETISAHVALARGVTAERHGSEVAALSYFLQANELDPTLLEAETRLNISSAAFTSGIAGTDARGEIQWRNQWISRLRETEEFISQFLQQSPAFYLVYSFSEDELAIDFARETVTIVVELRSLPEPTWFLAINQLTTTVRNALLATDRAETWGINWPNQSISTPSPFAGSNTTHTVVVEIFDGNGRSLGRQTANLHFDWFIPAGAEQTGTIVPRVQFNANRLSFSGIDVNIIDNLSIRITSIGNRDTETATSQLGIRVLPQNEYDRIQSIVDNGLRTDNLRQFNIQFTQNSNRLNGYSGSSTSIVIPFGVSLVDGNSGLQNRGLTSVKIPSSLTVIGEPTRQTQGGAFQGNRLTNIIIPDSVTSIGALAFGDNQLNNINIGANVRLSDDWRAISFGSWGSRTGFDTAYIDNGRRAGTYTSNDGNNWRFRGQ